MNVLKLHDALQKVYDEASSYVSRICELTPQELHNSRSEVSVSARVVLITCLLRNGWSEQEIADASGMSQQRVNSLKNSGKNRMNGCSAKFIAEQLNIYLSVNGLLDHSIRTSK